MTTSPKPSKPKTIRAWVVFNERNGLNRMSEVYLFDHDRESHAKFCQDKWTKESARGEIFSLLEIEMVPIKRSRT